MIVDSSIRRYFMRVDGTKDYIGRAISYRDENGERKQAFLSFNDLAESIVYQDIVTHLEREK